MAARPHWLYWQQHESVGEREDIHLETTILPLGCGDDDAAIGLGATILQAGGLVAFPTETVYGLGANALSDVAVRRIYEAKRRSPNDPCIVHLADAGEIGGVAVLPAGSMLAGRVAALAAAFWPGPLSLILPRGDAMPLVVTAGGDSVAVRVPAHPVALALLRAAAVPIAAPSANLFMHTSPTTAEHVRRDLGGRIELILDGGPTRMGVESTVLDLTGEVPTVLRPGGISLSQLRAVLGPVLAGARDDRDSGSAARDAVLPAPGMLATHYAPNAEVILLDGPTEAVRAALIERAGALIGRGFPVGALLPDQDLAALLAAEPEVIGAALGPQDDVEALARRLYAGMREIEDRGAAVILCRSIGGDGLGAAIADRLGRAAGGRIIRVG